MENKVRRRSSANRSVISNERKNVLWTDVMDEEFLEVMVEQCVKGRKVSTGFHKDGWNEMVSQLNEKFSNSGQTVDKNNLKNRWKTIKKQYSAMKELLKQSGFRWDDEKKMVNAERDVWDAYSRENPKAKTYFRKRLPDYNSLCMIFSNTVTDERYNSNPTDENMNDAVRLENNGAMRLEDNPPGVDELNETQAEEVQEGCASGPEEILPSSNNRCRGATPSSSRAPQGSIGEGIMDIMETFAKTLQDYTKKASDSTLQERVVAVLNEMKDSNEIDEDLYLETIFKLTDEKLVRSFLALHSGMRKPFLIKLTLRD